MTEHYLAEFLRLSCSALLCAYYMFETVLDLKWYHQQRQTLSNPGLSLCKVFCTNPDYENVKIKTRARGWGFTQWHRTCL